MYSPLTLPYLGLATFILLLLFVLLEIGVIETVYQKLGMSHRAIVVLLMASVVGSSINIPVAVILSGSLIHDRVVVSHGITYVIPHVMIPGHTIIAINVGGALIPILLCAYLLWRVGGLAATILAVTIVAAVTYHFSNVVPGLGITVPTLIPAVTATIAALLIQRRRSASLAYIAGTLGCLIGADILNLPAFPHFHAPMASIGGAGTFDAVFLSGIIAVLLA
ncbi:MAG: DUF1614 domain-containing protein [Candidatus Binataceae bacterium]